MAYPDYIDSSNLYDIGTVMVWFANIIKFYYYVTNYLTDFGTHAAKWVAATPGFAQTYLMLSN